MECVLYPEPTESNAEPQEEETPPWGLPEPLVKILHLLTKSQRKLLIALCVSEGKRVHHLFDRWTGNISPSLKKILVEQLESIDRAYPFGGLVGYLTNARDILEKKKNVVNPLEGWNPVAPLGEAFHLDTKDYTEVEKLGMRELNAVGFVVVAESKTKLRLPVEMATGTTYLQLYIESILAIETKYGKTLPLCIVTSSDDFDCVKSLLDENNRFGMTDEQITMINQSEGVPAFVTSEAKLVLDPNDEFKIVIKPHGNGDVHALLHKHGVAKKWKVGGTEWIVFMQVRSGI
jgi:UDP-sugar pyrophosphorylase